MGWLSVNIFRECLRRHFATGCFFTGYPKTTAGVSMMEAHELITSCVKVVFCANIFNYLVSFHDVNMMCGKVEVLLSRGDLGDDAGVM